MSFLNDFVFTLPADGITKIGLILVFILVTPHTWSVITPDDISSYNIGCPTTTSSPTTTLPTITPPTITPSPTTMCTREIKKVKVIKQTSIKVLDSREPRHKVSRVFNSEAVKTSSWLVVKSDSFQTPHRSTIKKVEDDVRTKDQGEGEAGKCNSKQLVHMSL